MGPAGHIEERCAADARNVAGLRHAVVEFAAARDASERELEDIAVAVSEALTNVVSHAYADRASLGEMGLQAWIDEQRLHVVVCDAGIGMRPRADGPGTGLGLAIIRRVVKHVRIEDARPGVRMHMAFAIDGS